MRLNFIPAAILLAVSAYQTGAKLPTSPVTAAMPPVAERRGEVGDVFVWAGTSGTESSVRVVAQTATEITLQSEDGCIRRARRDGFAPFIEWRGCGGNSGRQTSERVSGGILPLTEGRTETWKFSGTNSDGDSWEGTQTCTVMGAVAATVPAGTFDTYHVRCENKWLVYEWFIRADGVTVQWARTAKTGSVGEDRVVRLARFIPAPN